MSVHKSKSLLKQIEFFDKFEEIEDLEFSGFFVGWKNIPSPGLKDILKNSTYFIVAKIENKPVGIITCLSDKLISAYIPLLEVLPEYKKQGIGTVLVEKMLNKIGKLYMIDLICDPELNSYYAKFGFKAYNGCIVRNINS